MSARWPFRAGRERLPSTRSRSRRWAVRRTFHQPTIRPFAAAPMSLRRKLQRYYETENPRAPVRVVLPKGAYCPRFLLREEADRSSLHEHAEGSPPEPGATTLHSESGTAQAELVAAAPPVRRPARLSRREIALVAALAVFVPCAAYLGYGLRRGDSGRQFDPVILKAWGPLARPNADVLLCVATVLHLVVRPYMAVVAEGFPKYPAPPESLRLLPATPASTRGYRTEHASRGQLGSDGTTGQRGDACDYAA